MSENPECLNYRLPARMAALAKLLGFTPERALELRKIFLDDIMHIDKALTDQKDMAVMQMNHTLVRIQLCERTHSATEQYFLATMFGYDMSENDHAIMRMKTAVQLTDMLSDKDKAEMPEEIKQEYLRVKNLIAQIEATN